MDQPAGRAAASPRAVALALGQLAVSLGLVALLLWLVDPLEVWARLRGADPFELGAAAACLLATLPAVAWRWRVVSAALGAVPPPFAWYLGLTTIGMATGQALPAAYGGDAVRVGIAARRLGLMPAIRSVFAERIQGLVAILLLPLALAPVILGAITDARLAGLILTAAAAGVATYALAITLRRRVAMLPRVGRIAAAPLEDQLRVLLRPARAAAVVGMSLLVHVLNGLAFHACGLALGIDLGLLTTVALLPAAVLATLVPVSVAGWGLREGAAVLLFSVYGAHASEDVLATSILFGTLTAATVLAAGGVAAIAMSGARLLRFPAAK